MKVNLLFLRPWRAYLFLKCWNWYSTCVLVNDKAVLDFFQESGATIRAHYIEPLEISLNIYKNKYGR